MKKQRPFKPGDKVIATCRAELGEALTLVDRYFSQADPETVRWMCSFDNHPEWVNTVFYEKFLKRAKKQKPWWHKTTVGVLASPHNVGVKS